MLLASGAEHVTTLEYSAITSHHPKLTPMLPSDMARQFLDGTLPDFDAVVSFSSLEHSGLGRYGDGLNPYGDLITMARAWCVTKVS